MAEDYSPLFFGGSFRLRVDVFFVQEQHFSGVLKDERVTFSRCWQQTVRTVAHSHEGGVLS